MCQMVDSIIKACSPSHFSPLTYKSNSPFGLHLRIKDLNIIYIDLNGTKLG